MDSKCFLTSTDLQTRRARCQHQLSFVLLSNCRLPDEMILLSNRYRIASTFGLNVRYRTLIPILFVVHRNEFSEKLSS